MVNEQPAFMATHATGGDQSVSANTWTKINFETVSWDTASCYSTSGSRYTPNVAGYYLISGSIYAGAGQSQLRLFKNSSVWRQMACTQTSGIAAIACGSTIVYCNGTTDYLELYGNTSTTSFYTGFENIWFSGVLLKAA